MLSQTNHIINRISEGEGQQLDFKHSISDSKKIARSLSAFANTNGGSLLIGVRDNGSIKGVKSEEEFYMVETAAHYFCKPEIEFQHKLWKAEGKNILEIIIKEGNKKPYYAPDEKGTYRAYVRNLDQNLVADKVLREVWKLKSKNIKGVKITYNHVIEAIFEHIKKNKSISKSEILKNIGIKSGVADSILAKLVVMNILDYKLSESETRYVFTDKFLSESKQA